MRERSHWRIGVTDPHFPTISSPILSHAPQNPSPLSISGSHSLLLFLLSLCFLSLSLSCCRTNWRTAHSCIQDLQRKENKKHQRGRIFCDCCYVLSFKPATSCNSPHKKKWKRGFCVDATICDFCEANRSMSSGMIDRREIKRLILFCLRYFL
jgi:hypothetical protein